MTNSFVLPSCNYNIVISKSDLVQLMEKGSVTMRPLTTRGIFKSEFGMNRETDAHSLRYTDNQTAQPVQFVSIVLEK